MISESDRGIALTPGNYLITEFDRLRVPALGSRTLPVLLTLRSCVYRLFVCFAC